VFFRPRYRRVIPSQADDAPFFLFLLFPPRRAILSAMRAGLTTRGLTPSSSRASAILHTRPAPRLCLQALRRGPRARAGAPSGAFDESPSQPVSDEEKQISSSLMQQMQAKIGEALSAEEVSVSDMYGNSQHVTIRVVSSEFDGKTAVQRQRMVYKVRSPYCCRRPHAIECQAGRSVAAQALPVSPGLSAACWDSGPGG
jgi:stress-induced morphogen